MMTLDESRFPVILLATLCLAFGAPHGAAAEPERANTKTGEVVTITLAGDTGFSPNHAPVRKDGVKRHGQFQAWENTTRGIAPLVDGDLNFLNVETVVTDRNNLRRDTKGQRGPFNFRTHPNGMRHLVSRGFNVMSLANNHSMDYGVAGLQDTLRHVEALRRDGLLAANGIGVDRETASRPDTINVAGSNIGFSSIGIVTNNLARHRAGPQKPGQIAYRFDDDYRLVLKRLSETPADFRMLSIHYGLEGRVRTDSKQVKEWRYQAALGSGIDLIVGHHAHVPRGVEVAGKSVIFYGLGNFLHHGTANMSGKGICKDYGLFAKVHLLRQPDGQLEARAIEAIPLTAMHRQPKPLTGTRAAARIHALNYLGSRLGSRDGAAKGVRFTPMPNGTGLYCKDGAANDPGKIGALCTKWRPPPAIPSNLKGRIAASCSR